MATPPLAFCAKRSMRPLRAFLGLPAYLRVPKFWTPFILRRGVPPPTNGGGVCPLGVPGLRPSRAGARVRWSRPPWAYTSVGEVPHCLCLTARPLGLSPQSPCGNPVSPLGGMGVRPTAVSLRSLCPDSLAVPGRPLAQERSAERQHSDGVHVKPWQQGSPLQPSATPYHPHIKCHVSSTTVHVRGNTTAKCAVVFGTGKLSAIKRITSPRSHA